MKADAPGAAALVRRLEERGWRIRPGGWPDTVEDEALWDFCFFKGSDGAHYFFPMNDRAIRFMSREGAPSHVRGT